MRQRYRALFVVVGLGLLSAGCHRDFASAEEKRTGIAPVPAPFDTPVSTTGGADVATLVEKVKPVVVNITTEHDVAAKRPQADEDGDDPFGGMFGQMMPGRRGGRGGQRGERGEQPAMKQRALGTGFLIDAKGHVVTNNHVIDGADRVRVKLADDREFVAKIIGRDERLDLAVLELENGKDLPAASLGSSEGLRVGESVVAIGNPFGLGNTVTMGIVSAKGREIGSGPYDDFIQTDASINPGNSGGPLFNLRGQVIGINAAINPNGKGIGFAIPIDALKDVLAQLMEKGHVSRGKLGALVQPVDASMATAIGLPNAKGALVDEVEKNGAAERAGIQEGDVITKVDEAEVKTSADLPRLIARHAPGTTVALHVVHDKKEKTIDAKLDELKTDDGAKKGARQQQQQQQQPDAPATVAPGSLGIEIRDGEGGAQVMRVAPNGPSAEALAPGDVIVEVNHQPVTRAADVAKAVKAGGGVALLRVEREGKRRFVAVTRKP